jgi:ABC-2 type transport system ATP-binding protein
MIEVEKLTKRYGSYEALKGITFKAKQGEIVGLLGPNGAGKTTTMRILTGYMPPTSGRVTIDGLDIVNDSAAVRARVGYMPERVPIYPDMTVEGYVAFWARLRGVSNVRERVGVALERVHLQDRRRSLVRNLSKGMKQRLGLAQALVHEPQVIILDEPTIGIDPRQVIEVREAVRELGRDHTVIFSTHILSEAEQVCDRVVILNRGEIIAQGKPDEMRRQLERGQSLFVALGKVNAADAVKLLSGVQGVRAVEPYGTGFVLRVQQGADVRGNIAKRIHDSGATLLEMRPVAMTLEDIFLDLVERQEGRA